jgi:amino acid adenylation domain-containing protein
MYAGMVAVPVYPPDVFRLRQTLPRLQAITSDANANIMLSSREVLGDSVGPLWSLCGDRAVATEEIENRWSDNFRGPSVRAGDLALLQFTSGSTGTPRGVALTHANIMANAQQGFYAFDVPNAVCVFWLPPYHDLGLIGGMLIPVFGGRHSVLMSPIAFLQQPIRWFEAISRFRGTTTASPNFGYEWCIRKIQPEHCEGLDLSSWKLAAVGAEPVRAGTLERFAERFSGLGFSYSAFTPGYGLAEATLAVTSKPVDGSPVVRHFDANSLHAESPQAVPVVSKSDAVKAKQVALVSSGQPVSDCEVRIVDPVTCQLLPDGNIGEIWVNSPAVAREYWKRPDESSATFGGKLDGAPRGELENTTYMRTGDLGFLLDGELFVSGRLKEQIIVAGRNFFPHDIETAIQSSHEAFKVDGGVAFSIDHPEGERLVVVHEVLRPKRFDLAELLEGLRRVVFEETGLMPHAVCLVAAASLPKTSSGKLRRLECKRQFMENDLQLLGQWEATETADATYPVDLSLTSAGTDDHREWTNTQRRLEPLWCESLEIRRAELGQHFLEAGGQSLGATQLLMRIREEFATKLTIADLVRCPRFGELAAEIDHRLDRPEANSDQNIPTASQPARQMQLTGPQRRFWLLDQLDHRDAFLHVGVEYQIHGAVDVERLIDCCRALPARHEALRIMIGSDAHGDACQTILDEATVAVELHECGNEPSSLDGIRDALIKPRFDLARGPLIRIAVVRFTAQDTRVLLAAHHIVADGWSLGIIAQDLATAYANPSTTAETSQPESTDCGKWAISVARRLDAERLQPSAGVKSYWRERMIGAPVNSSLDLLDTNIKPLTTGSDSASVVRYRISRTQTLAIEHSARRLGVTPFSLLVTAWHAVLAHYRSDTDMIFGIPVANRTERDEEKLVGCFINILPFRMGNAETYRVDDRIDQHVQKTNGALLQDLSHAEIAAEEILRDALQVQLDDSSPMVRHLILQQPKPSGEVRFGEATLVDYQSDYSCLSAYDTAFIVENHGDSMELALAFNPELIPKKIANNLVVTLNSALQEIATSFNRSTKKSLQELAIPSDHERDYLRNKLTRYDDASTSESWVDDSFMQMFAARVAATPDAKAIEDAKGSLSYSQLDIQSAKIGQWLHQHGYGVGSRVGVLLRRTPETIAVLIGIWKSGAAYLPLDWQQPTARLRSVITDAAPNGIFVDSETRAELDEISTACPLLDASRIALEIEKRAGDASAESRFLAKSVQLGMHDPAYLIYTSGSTGKPKGVVVGHHSLANFLRAMSRRPGLRANERLLASTTLTFDISILEVFLPLVVGGTTLLAPNSLSEDPDGVMQFMQSRRIDVLQSTPSSLRLLLALGWKPAARLRVWCGGEPMPIDLADDLIAAGAELWNMYGPTETTVWSSVARVPAAHGGLIPIGAPIDQTIFRIVDLQGRDVPEGVAGELWIGGDGVALGYWKRPDLNAERFVVIECGKGERVGRHRFYKTGDSVRLRTDGDIEILGRKDRQIKLLGHRIELGEIEQHLLAHPRIREAAVTVVGTSESDRQIISFYTCTDERPLTSEQIRTFLFTSLPGVMVPSAIVRLSSIPLTPAGKVDYRVLPTDRCVLEQGMPPVRNLPSESRTGEVVETSLSPIEREIADIWVEVLQVPAVSLDDHFFHLGGHSLKAAQVFARLRSRFAVDLPLREIYAKPTVRKLAAWIAESLESSSQLSMAVNQTSDILSGQISVVTTSTGATEHDLDAGEQPLSFAEQRLWFVDRLEPNHPFYNLPLAADIRGPLDLDVLTESFNDVIARHETLRSTYRLIDGHPVREVASGLRVKVEAVDLTTDGGEIHADDLKRLLHEEARRPFNLASAPLVRVTAFQVSHQHYVVLLVMHHIISDGWSMAVMLSELAECYRARRSGTAAQLPQIQTSYRRYAIEQRHRLNDESIRHSMDYWRKSLSGGTETLDLPTDFDRPAVQDFEGATLPFELSDRLTNEVLRIARAHEATPFMVMLAAYSLLLSRYSGQQDLNVGTAVANRTDASLEPLIGFFVGTMVLRVQAQEKLSFSELLEQVRDTTIQAYEHAEVPFEKLVETLAGKRDRSHSPLFQAAMVMQNAPRNFQTAPELSMVPMHVDNGTAKYDLTLFVWEQDGRMVGHFEYRTSLFDSQTIGRMGECLTEIVRAIVNDPRGPIADIDLLPESMRASVVARSFGPIVRTESPRVFHKLVYESVRKHGDRLAISDGTIHWTYGQMHQQATKIAAGLQQLGVVTETPVLLFMRRSAQQIATQLGTMQAGGAFIPVDTSVPVGRIESIVADAKCRFVVVDEEFVDEVSAVISGATIVTVSQLAMANEKDWVDPCVQNHHLAYMIFTSGSTGKPKGVLIEHEAICNFVEAFCERVEVTSEDRFLYNLSPSFDGALSQSFTALAMGASVEVVSHDVLMDPVRLTDLINQRGVTFAACTPSMFAALDSDKVLGMKKVLSAGEALTSEAAQPWLESHQLFNGYGPTECTIGSAIHPIKPGFGRIPPIGKPLRNMSMYVLDERKRLVPDGVVGDVYIGGESVGRGYLNLPELTAERFVNDPFIQRQLGKSGRMYLTGDLGRWNRDGVIEILGRGDNQIKLRGFRIEPGEIAAAMEQLPEVSAAAVVAWGESDSPGAQKRLVGYFVPEKDALQVVDDSNNEARQLEKNHIDSWRQLFDQSHQQSGLVLRPEDDFSGWQSVITGELIPVPLMREWADHSARRIRKLNPNRILEIGCGTGLILLRLGNEFSAYEGLDVLPSSVEQLNRTAQDRHDLKSKVEARVGLADQLDVLPPGEFDVIVLNSVVQYFPSMDYLMTVLVGLQDRLARGGKVFLGDLRDLRLHGAFATEVELARSSTESLTVAKLRRRVMSRMEHDEELLLDPAMFEHLHRILPRLTRCDVQYKEGSDQNELNRYRFDVTMFFDGAEDDAVQADCVLPDARHDRQGRTRREFLLWRLLKSVDGDVAVSELVDTVDRWLSTNCDWGQVVINANEAGWDLADAAEVAVANGVENWGNNPLQRRRSLELVSRMRDQLRERLPEYMIPSAFVALERLPLTVQGKLDKKALPPPPAARPDWAGNWKSARDEHETLLVEVWEDLLEVDPIGIEDDFFELGGHSMLAVRMVSEIERRTGIALPLAALFQKATISHLSEFLRNPAASAPTSALIPLAKGSDLAPLFCIHPAGGTVFCYRDLAAHFEGRRAVYGLQARGVDGLDQPHQTVEEMAEYYAQAIRHVSPDGPYHLVGWSLGGNIAYEVARNLSVGGGKIGLLALLDSGLLSADEPLNEADFLPLIAALFPGDAHLPLEQLRLKSPHEQLEYFVHQAAQAGIVPTDAGKFGAQIFRVFQANIKAVHGYRPTRFEGEITLVRPADQTKTGELFDDETLGWETLATSVKVLRVPGDHAGMLRSPAVDQIAGYLK